MQPINIKHTDEAAYAELTGCIDSSNAMQIQEELLTRLHNVTMPIILDMQTLNYISSAGLRVLLKLRKAHTDTKIINVNPDVYEILDMTGFTQIMPISRAYRVISLDGCEEIGRGANGIVYRAGSDIVVKAYRNADALSVIQHEREVAKLALILGIPTAISYDVVRIGDTYGSVFELLNARSFAKILDNEPERFDWCVKEFTDLLHLIHATEVPEGALPDMRETAIGWVEFLADYLPEKAFFKLLELIRVIPKDNHMIHGDYHAKNVQLQNDEVLLIDMDTLAVGHPIFEFASMYNAFLGFNELRHEHSREFMGIDYDVSFRFWKATLAAYLHTYSADTVQAVEDKARVIGYTRLIRRSIRRHGLETAKGRAEIDHWKKELCDLLEKTDTLLF